MTEKKNDPMVKEEEGGSDISDLDIESTTVQGLHILDFTSYSRMEESDDFVLAKLPMDLYKQLVRIAQGEKIPEKEVHIKGSWTEDEDKQLVEYVEKYGAKRWSFIASHLKGRVGKQCRERYLNHLDPSIKKTEWTEDEDQIIMSMHDKLGNQWAKIARSLSGRTANAVKNHWNSTLRRRVEKMNMPSVPIMQAQHLIPITQPLLMNPGSTGTPASATSTPGNLNHSFLFPLPDNMNVQSLMNQAQLANQIQLLQNSIGAATAAAAAQQQSHNAAFTSPPVPQQPPKERKRERSEISGGDNLLEEMPSSAPRKKFRAPTIAIENDNTSDRGPLMKTPSMMKTPQGLSTGLTPSSTNPLDLSIAIGDGPAQTPLGGSAPGSDSGLTLQSPSHVSLELWSPKNSSMFSPCSRFLKINVKPLQ